MKDALLHFMQFESSHNATYYIDIGIEFWEEVLKPITCIIIHIMFNALILVVWSFGTTDRSSRSITSITMTIFKLGKAEDSDALVYCKI